MKKLKLTFLETVFCDLKSYDKVGTTYIEADSNDIDNMQVEELSASEIISSVSTNNKKAKLFNNGIKNKKAEILNNEIPSIDTSIVDSPKVEVADNNIPEIEVIGNDTPEIETISNIDTLNKKEENKEKDDKTVEEGYVYKRPSNEDELDDLLDFLTKDSDNKINIGSSNLVYEKEDEIIEQYNEIENNNIDKSVKQENIATLESVDSSSGNVQNFVINQDEKNGMDIPTL